MDHKKLEKLKHDSLGHLLIKAGRLYKEHTFALLKEELNIESLKPSHLDLVAYIEFSGSSIVEIAARMGISKQAVSVLVKDLLDLKLLKRVGNPDDKRSFLVTFNHEGPTNILEAMTFLASLDEGLESLVGKSKVKPLRASLVKIIDELSR